MGRGDDADLQCASSSIDKMVEFHKGKGFAYQQAILLARMKREEGIVFRLAKGRGLAKTLMVVLDAYLLAESHQQMFMATQRNWGVLFLKLIYDSHSSSS